MDTHTPMVVPVIMAGGKGERFWPLSRKDRPKQFLRLLPDGRSLIGATADRLLPMVGGWENVWVVTSFNLLEGIGEHLPPLPAENLLIEPEPRDTTAAIAWSTLEIAKRYGDDAILAIFPADHWISDETAFQDNIQAAAILAAERDVIVTLGIQPTHPSTGYGYIEQGYSVGFFRGHEARRVLRFAEKPDLQTAKAFINSGHYTWNAGIFIFRAGIMLAELRRYAPEILEPLKEKGRDAYPELIKKSIDYSVMEKSDRVCVIPATFGWDDLGDWGSLERLMGEQGKNLEMAKHIGLDTSGSIFYTTSGNDLIVTLGMEDVLIVRDGPVTLIAKKERSQEIKKVLESLRRDPELVELL